jgi:hypothetical protein
MSTRRNIRIPKMPPPQSIKDIDLFESVDTWKNRRRMTWVAVVVGLIVYPLLLFISGGLFPNAGALVESVQFSLYSLIGGIVLSYFGGVTAEDIIKNKGSKKNEQ